MLPQYNDFLNQKLEPTHGFVNLSESKKILLAGGKENLALIKEYKICDTEEELYEFLDFLGKGFAGNKRLGIEITSGVISALIGFLPVKITKGSIFWYLLTYGMSHAIHDMGKDILNPDKKVDFCESFSKGAASSIADWATVGVINKLLKVIGIDLSGSTVARFGMNSLGDLFRDGDNNTWIHELFESTFCGDDFMVIDGKRMSLWDSVYELGASTFSGIWSLLGDDKEDG